MHKNFEINYTKIKGGCQSGRKVVTHNSMSDLPLVLLEMFEITRDVSDRTKIQLRLKGIFFTEKDFKIQDKIRA